MNPKILDWTLLLVCNLCWASQPALAKLVQEGTGIGPLSATIVPVTLATVALLPIVLVEAARRRALGARPARRLRLADLFGFLAIGILGQLAAQLSITWGSNLTLASNASLLFLALPVVTAVMAFLILGEKMSPLRWVAFVLAIAGAATCSGIEPAELDIGNRAYAKGNGLVLVCVAASAFYNVYSKRLLERYSPLEVLFGSYVVMVIAMAPVTFWAEPDVLRQIATYSGRVWMGVLLLAVFVYFAAIVVFLIVLSRIDAIQAGLSNYLIPVFGLFIGGVILGEHLSPMIMLGGALVLASTLLITLVESRQAQPAETVPVG